MNFDKLPVNWFDGFIVIVVIFGLWLGRKNGMTKEILPAFQWLSVLLACGFGYPILAVAFANSVGVGELASDYLGYCTVALVVFLVFAILKRIFNPILTGSNFFGAGEYYLGMAAGAVHYACLLLVALSLLNGPYYTPQEIQRRDAYMQRWFGGGMYAGNFFPSVHGVQELVFKKSFTGPYLKDYIGVLLIETAPPPAAKKEAPEKVKKKPVIRMGN